MLRKALTLVFLVMFAFAASEAIAAPPWAGDSGKGKGYKKEKKPKKAKKQKHRGKYLRFSGGPPPWAPAHGYRRKRGGGYYSGRAVYAVPFGIDRGTCNRTEVGAVIGGVAGGVLGSRIGKGDDKLAATIIGTIAGAVIGGYVGRSLDRADEACVGQVMEHANTGSKVIWTNPDTRTRYEVTPHSTFRRDDGRYCREYTAGVSLSRGGRTDAGLACRRSDGTWDIIR
ncbi:MAG: RT0821/Lpp0805 family surface protein [Alphaproteobacteria bacterium]|nr:RT0821/Lpp0805 family surface protein [Alphaproteobacteria bacterium]